MRLHLAATGFLLLLLCPRDAQAQRIGTDRWYPTTADSASQATASTPSPLQTWQVVLPLGAGVALWAYNPTPDSIRIPTVEVWDCVNIVRLRPKPD